MSLDEKLCRLYADHIASYQKVETVLKHEFPIGQAVSYKVHKQAYKGTIEAHEASRPFNVVVQPAGDCEYRDLHIIHNQVLPIDP